MSKFEDIFDPTASGNSSLLREMYGEAPFSILNTCSSEWVKQKDRWKKMGIKSEVGRDAPCLHFQSGYDKDKGDSTDQAYTSIFDPYLTEICYRWWCPDNGTILDPFSGGSVRGLIAAMTGHKYAGIDIRPEQIEANEQQVKDLITNPEWTKPVYFCGDSNKVLDTIANNAFDMIFTCPPYADLEVYSTLDGDISNMDYSDFLTAYRSIIKKSCDKLKPSGYAVFVVGEVRDKHGNYYGFVPDTIRAFTDIGMKYYNEAILANPVGSGAMRARKNMQTQKLVKRHQNVLVFKKV